MSETFIRWYLLFEYVQQRNLDEAHRNLCQLTGWEIINRKKCKTIFQEIDSTKPGWPTFMKTCNFQLDFSELNFPSNVHLAMECRKKQTDLYAKYQPEEFHVYWKKIISSMGIPFWEKKLVVGLTKKLTSDSHLILTSLCCVKFLPGGYGYTLMVPTDFDPSRVVASNDPYHRLFEEIYLLSKPFMKHGQLYSIHEILCYIFDCNPETTILSDENLIMLPLWDIGSTKRHIENYSSGIFDSFLKILPNNHLQYCPTDACQKFIGKLHKEVEKKLSRKIFLFNENYILGEKIHPKVNQKDVQRALVLCASRSVLNQYMMSLCQGLHGKGAKNSINNLCDLIKELMTTLKQLETRYQTQFPEIRKGQYSQLVKLTWQMLYKVLFRNDLLPRLVKQVLDLENQPEYYGITKKFIHNELIMAYYQMGVLKNNNSTKEIDLFTTKPNPLDYYYFVQWHIKYYNMTRSERFLGQFENFNNQRIKKMKRRLKMKTKYRCSSSPNFPMMSFIRNDISTIYMN